MDFNNLTLYKSYMDSTYNNVVDIVDDINIINIPKYFKEKYLDITFVNNKLDILNNNSFRGININSDKSITITLNKSVVGDLHGYNYIALWNSTTNNYYFGFINSYREVGNTVYEILVTYDIWHNNLSTIKDFSNKITVGNINEPISNYVSMVKGHLPSYYYNNGEYFPLKYETEYQEIDNYVDSIKPIRYVEVEHSDYNEDGYEDDYASMLFVKIITSEEIKILEENASEDTIVKSYFGSIPIYYIPIGLLITHGNEMKYKPFRYRKGLELIYRMFTTINDVPDLSAIFSGEDYERVSNYIISATLTFNVPFDYYVSLDTIESDTIYTVQVLSCMEYQYRERALSDYVNPFIILSPTISRYSPSSNRITYDNYHITKNVEIEPTTKFELTNNQTYLYNVLFDMYPFTTKCIQIGEYKNILDEKSLTYTSIEIELLQDTDVIGIRKKYYSTIDNSNFITRYDYVRCSDKKEIPFSKDSLQYFLSTSGASAYNAKWTGIANSSLAGLTNTIRNGANYMFGDSKMSGTGLLTTLKEILFANTKYRALLRDADNAFDTAVSGFNRGDIDFYYVDLPLMVVYKPIDNDTLKNIKFNIYRYGYDVNVNIPIFGYAKYYFDYTQAYNVDFNITGIDNYDKIRIIELYKRGFTRNHLHLINGVLESKTYINKTTHNLDYDIESEG